MSTTTAAIMGLSIIPLILANSNHSNISSGTLSPISSIILVIVISLALISLACICFCISYDSWKNYPDIKIMSVFFFISGVITILIYLLILSIIFGV